MKISFELTMPNVGSWNGKWSGEDKKYYHIATFTKRIVPEFMKGKQSAYWYYNFGDGWGARVSAEIVDSQEAVKRKKISIGFCGYEWMVESIIKYGNILNSNQIKNKESVL